MITDNELIEKIKKYECGDSISELIKRHSAIVISVYNKFLPHLLNAGVAQDDIYNEKDFLIYQQAKSFDATKNTKFSTRLANYARFQCLNLINKKKEFTYEDKALHFLIDNNPVVSYTMDNDLRLSLRKAIRRIKDERARRIYRLRYLSNKKKLTSWAKVSKKVEISPQTAINIHNKYIRNLKSKIENFYRDGKI